MPLHTRQAQPPQSSSFAVPVGYLDRARAHVGGGYQKLTTWVYKNGVWFCLAAVALVLAIVITVDFDRGDKSKDKPRTIEDAADAA